MKLSSTDPTFPKDVNYVCDYVDEYIRGLIQRQEKLPVPEESIYRSRGAPFQPIIKPKKEKFELKPGSTEEEEESQRIMFDNEERRKEEDYLRAVSDQKRSLAVQQQEAASYGLKQAVMSIVEHRQLKPNDNSLPNSPLYNDLFKRTKQEDDDAEAEREEDYADDEDDVQDEDDDDDDADVNEDVAQEMIYKERRKKITTKKE